MKRTVLIGLVMLACGLVPARPASAQAGFIRWLEKLSGPGPFVGGGFEINGLCFGAEKDAVAAPDPPASQPRGWFWDVNCARAARNRQRLTVGVQFAKLTGDNNLQYDETVPGDLRDNVTATVFLGTADLGVARALDVGAGFGFIRFTGTPPGGFSRFSAEPLRVTLKPFAMRPVQPGDTPRQLYRREWLQLRVVMTVIPGGFDAEDFGAIPGTFHSDTEIQANMYIIVNLANIVGW
jgi:hypothetical protein